MKFWKDCRGSTVIMIAWLLAVMGVIVAFLLYRSELEWAAVVNTERNLQARYLAETVLQERLALLIQDDSDEDTHQDPWYDGDGYLQFERDGYQITVVIEDESSKPNINLLSKDELKFAELSDEEADILLDWIDSDSEIRPEGAELAEYQGLNPPYKPRDGLISSMKELLALKKGQEIYEKLTPYVTTFGKYSLNTMNGQSIENLLLSYGFDKVLAERIANDFTAFRAKERFNEIDDLLKLSSVTITTRDQLKKIVTTKGIINLNFISKTGLEMVLKKVGIDTELADQIINRRIEQPFTTIEDIQGVFRAQAAKLNPEDYFTYKSTIFRYQIWLVKGKRRFYLNTVQERIPGNTVRSKWQVIPLEWNFASNQDVPELPVIKETDEELPNDG